MSAATITATVTSVAPAERVHAVRIETLASTLGFEIANRSMTVSIEDVVTETLTKHGISGDIAGVAGAIEGEITTDRSGASDINQAVTAADSVLEELFGSSIDIIGWAKGEQQLINGDIFEFTGHACAGCGINPEAVNRTFRGVRCANAPECGHTVRF